ncbi:hypothetical protein SAMN05444159_2273 [Bradyrhizobium lablabi]|uniref:Uncharacterized protein n=1 Tax=Bradyrhizobium lablabi TaxID=722472 RepID=A0A1M6PA53_9BRAD|nr:hypothetical protein SAMN05444159_2273 [Bradyrhizobium lablabi]
MGEWLKSGRHFFLTSPRLRREVGFCAWRKIRVRGTLRESEFVERAPHPNPLPAKGGAREKEAGEREHLKPRQRRDDDIDRALGFRDHAQRFGIEGDVG